MDSSLVSTKRTIIGAVILILNPLLYLAIEAVTAAAWTQPPYSYSSNYISDLGVPGVDEFQGRTVHSPLHVLMNTGFVLHGVLFVIAGILLWRLLAQRAAQIAYLALAIAHGIGISLVGLFHGSTAAVEDGTVAFHSLGAMLAIIGGNSAAIVVGASVSRRMASFGRTLIALGVIGIASLLYLVATGGSAVDGIPERVAVYTVMIAQLVAGVSLLLSRRRIRGSAG